MRVAIVRPGEQGYTYCELVDVELTAVEPPTWAAMLTAYLRRLACDVVVFDEVVENWDHQQTAKRVTDERPELIVIVVSGTNPSSSTPTMPAAIGLTQALKRMTDTRVMLLGLHPTALPERSLSESGADFVCLGEGFYTLADFLLLRGSTDYSKVRGLCCKDGVTKQPPPWEKVELLPEPAWDLLSLSRYRAHNWHCFDDLAKRQPYAAVYTSLGCPFSCSFCCVNSFFGKTMIRYRDADAVACEVDELVKKQGVRNVKFIDEMFALNTERVKTVCAAIERLGHDLNIWAYARVNTVNAEQLRYMRKAGVRWLAYGIESGDDRVLDNVSKHLTTKAMKDVVRMTQDEGISVCGNYIFGLPGDDHDSMVRTLELAFDLRTEWANFYSVIPYPGSRLYDEAVANKLPLPDSWSGYSQYASDCRPLPTEKLSSQQILEFRDLAFKLYYNDYEYRAMLHDKFGQQAVRSVDAMLRTPLKRDFTRSVLI